MRRALLRLSLSFSLSLSLTAACWAALAGDAAAQTVDALQACRIKGIERELRCGQVEVPEDAQAPAGRRLGIHFAVVPALARNHEPDPVFILAGGPGQSAIDVAGGTLSFLARLNARRDLVFVDQRGTGRSQRLGCPVETQPLPLAEALDAERALARMHRCLAESRADTRHYATTAAMRDLDAVRVALGTTQINLWGASYGTRAALEYLRLYPQHVRSVVLDGVAPADMALPASMGLDADVALQGWIERCAREAACARQYPRLAQELAALLTAPARTVSVADPLTGQPQTFTLDNRVLADLLRVPLYAPPLAALLPQALTRASEGDVGPLVAALSVFAGNPATALAEGMHFAVICAEDMPRITPELDSAARATRLGAATLARYRAACAQVATRPAAAEFYRVSDADVPVLLLSGGADPVTPPRHGERIAAQLRQARHLVAPALGHGVSSQGCAPDLIARFVRQAGFDGIDGACLARLPAPPVFQPPRAAQRP